MTTAAVFDLLWESLADLLGTAATAVLLRRARKRAASRYLALHDLVITREGLDYTYSVPRAWQEQEEGSADASLQELIVELRPLLIELTEVGGWRALSDHPRRADRALEHRHMIASDHPRRGPSSPARLINDIARTLESSEDAESRVRHGLELLRGIVPYDCCALLETRAGRERRLVLVPELVADERASMTETLDQLLALLSGAHEHPTARAERAADAPLKSWRHHLAVPLIGLDHVIGVLFLGSVEEPYDEEDLSLLSIVAAQLAAYLMTVRLQQEKDEFIATLSHELRTPLTAVLGWASLLRSGSLGEAARLRGVEAVARNATTLTRLTDDLLDLSRIATGKLRVELRALSVQQVVGSAIDAARPLANTRSILLDYEVDQVDGLVLGDADRLQQVVSNLLTNALKFTPSGGRVTVRVEQTERQVSIEVRDTGKGISEDFLPYVFDRSRQAALSSRRGYDGLGLGLGIVRSLVQLHGGQVRAESAGPGAGATFTVVLPLAPMSDSPLPAPSDTTTTDAPPTTTVRLLGARVLVVDDDADVREVIQTILELHGAEVTSAGSATEALAAIEQSIPNVLLCDISMPDEDGPSLLRRVTKRWPRIPAAALTARTTAADRDRALEAGFSVHVAKPVEPEVLITTVGRLWNEASELARL